MDELDKTRKFLLEERDRLASKLEDAECELKQAEEAVRGFKDSLSALNKAIDQLPPSIEAEKPAVLPRQDGTIKDFVKTALAEQFPNGATARQILELYTETTGRELLRESLSPQLSRLKNEGSLISEKGKWILISKEDAK
ncbi:MAG: hypothetical protein GYB19_15140 [Rhodospirillales bacterium]|nr:hypothetical protein [Rhodospirillales bacterium]